MAELADSHNRLATETSPYLLQHAGNPVAWYPWGAEALQRARRERKPILLSIGYSACHWCHVMAHESFADPATAQIMNRLYVNVKVDREERPDLDRIYQSAHQLLTGRPGGWPLTVFLTPEQVPYFAGTYFPREPRHGLPGFKDLLVHIASYWHQHPQQVAAQSQALLSALQRAEEPESPTGGEPPLQPPLLAAAREALASVYDPHHGGFGRAPKFPHPSTLELLLDCWGRGSLRGDRDPAGLEMVRHTLLRMAEGGIYDHLGGGFYRYSVDQAWTIPHFEKMLYDNGPLLALNSQLWRLTGDGRFARAARETAGWVMREMQAPEGGYYASQDADSEGGEGRFYLWDRDELAQCLEARELAPFARRFGLERAANFEGRWHLHGCQEEEVLARELGLEPSELATLLDQARRKLFLRRQQRPPPGRDEKLLSAWNALMIKGMAVASRHLEEPAWAHSARRSLAFVHDRLWDGQRLLAVYKDGVAKLPAYLDDHALLIDAVLELAQCDWQEGDLDFAVALAERLLEAFEDPDQGGFHFTARDHEPLIHRPKPSHDDALPSGNGIAARALLRLGHLIGEPRYLQAAERTLRWAAPHIQRAPAGHTSLLLALAEWLEPGQTVVLRGEPGALEGWRKRAAAAYAPGRLTLAIPDSSEPPGLVAARRGGHGLTAYSCSGTQCSAPICDPALLESTLAAGEPRLA